MTEAVEVVTDYAFNSLDFEKLVFLNAVDNARSARIKEKTGSKLVGQIPIRCVGTANTEGEVYELTKTSWRRFKENRVLK